MVPVKFNNVYNAAYYIEAHNAPGFSRVAISPNVVSEYLINWKTTNGRGDQVPVQIPLDLSDPSRITVNLSPNRFLILQKLTKDIYDEKVKPFVNGHPEFNSDAELQDFYLNADFSH
jgi:hypothetical protein